MNNGKEKIATRLGFILISAGCAIGVGNVWKFPGVVGENGGGIFVLFYLIFLAIIGVPVMTMEFSLGRASGRSPVRMYDPIAPKGSKWFLHGYLSLVGNVLLAMFYIPVTSWMLIYFTYSLVGKFQFLSATEISALFSSTLATPLPVIVFTLLTILLSTAVCSFNLQNVFEKAVKFMMLALLVIMIFLAVYSLTLEGAREGVRFYLLPRRVTGEGLIRVITAAMNQAFFTLSVGIGSMAVFGSYIDKKRSLLGESITIACLDTFVAIVCGLIIFPACASFGIDVETGPALVFEVLPQIFNSVTGGRAIGAFFFIFMSFAALTTVFAIFQNIVACLGDIFPKKKKTLSALTGASLSLLTLPCILGFNLLKWSDEVSIMDIEDYLVSNILLPIGALVIVLFCTRKNAWGFDAFSAEANQGKGAKIKRWMKPYLQYLLPLIILFIFVIGIFSF